MAYMAQAEQTRLYFKSTGDTEDIEYIDLAAAMTAANRVQYHQVTDKGKPLCYAIRATSMKGSFTISAAQNTFCTANAVTMTCAGELAQLKHAGISHDDKSTYGRHCRFALEGNACREDDVNFPEAPDGGFVISNAHMVPYVDNECTDPYFKTAGYVASDGITVLYKDPGGIIQLGDVPANQITTVIVGDEVEEPLVLLDGAPSSGGTSFNVVHNYRSGRKSGPDVDVADTIPSGDMASLFSVAEEQSAEISATVADFMEYKPYVPDDESAHNFDECTTLMTIDQATSATTQWPPASDSGLAPLGLLKVVSGDANSFQLDVLAIYEM